MRIFNEDKTCELSYDELDFGIGDLVRDFIIIQHHDKVAAKSVQEQIKELQAQGKEIEQYDGLYYIVLNKYNNGGKEVKLISDIAEQPAYDETEEIFVFKYFTEDELLKRKKEDLRSWRLTYLDILDRACWYDCLTQEQKAAAKEFRQQLLDITDTLVKPEIPDFIAKEVKITD